MPDLPDVYAHAHLLLGPAEAALRAKLEAAPEDPALRWRLAETLRQRGDLDGARAALRALAEGPEPPPRVAAVLAALEGRPVPEAPGPRPAPFLSRAGALDEAERELLWATVRAHADAFDEGGVYSREGLGPKPDFRRTLVLRAPTIPDVAARFRERIPPLVAEAWAARGLPAFTPGHVDVSITAHVDGGFFRAHNDRRPTGPHAGRAVTFLYYFHREPKPFSGGDLLLLDTGRVPGRYGPSYTRVTPDDGRLVLFPSEYVHQVTPVASATGRLEDARFAVTGWVYDAAAAS